MSIGIVGLGYVGLPLAVAFAEAGERVVGVDVDPGKVAALREGRSYVEDIPSERLAAVLRPVRVHHRAPSTLARGGGDPRLRPHAAEPQPRARPRAAARRHARAGGVIRSATSSSCSSRPPSPAPRASTSSRCWRSPASRPGATSHLAFSPERVDPGRTDYTLRNTPKIVGGLTPACTDARARGLRARVRPPRAGLHARGGRARQAAGEHLPLGQHRARQRAGDPRRPHGDRHLGGRRRRGHQAVRLHARSSPGPGMGGHCLPVDPFYLTWKAREYDLVDGVHRARGQGQQADAVLLPGEDRARR